MCPCGTVSQNDLSGFRSRLQVIKSEKLTVASYLDGLWFAGCKRKGIQRNLLALVESLTIVGLKSGGFSD